jgi:hypothetical protein
MVSFLRTLLLLFIKSAAAQSNDNPASLCSCTPLVYTWKLDFSSSCPPANITVGNGAGIQDVYCAVKADGLTDKVPISVTSYQIIELDQLLIPVKVKTESDINLKDGDLISFSSITSAEPNTFAGGLQATVDGLNSANESIVLEWIVRFSNLCEVYPFSNGDSLGWMKFLIQVSSLLS